MPLVPRHGARVLRGRGDRRGPSGRIRGDQGRPRGAAGPRPGLHDCRAGDDRLGRLADERLPDTRGQAFLRWNLLPQRRSARVAVFPGCAGRRSEGMAGRSGRGRVIRRPSGRRAGPSRPGGYDRRDSSVAGPSSARCGGRCTRDDLRSSSCCAARPAPTAGRVPMPVLWPWRSGPWTQWPTAASTTSWGAGSTATRPTRPGSCPTSSRCCTTTPSWHGSTSTPGSSPVRSVIGTSPAERSITWLAS